MDDSRDLKLRSEAVIPLVRQALFHDSPANKAKEAFGQQHSQAGGCGLVCSGTQGVLPMFVKESAYGP